MNNAKNTDFHAVLKMHEHEIKRIIDDTQNAYSFSQVTFIYGRLKRLGPWKPSELTMEVVLEIDMMHAALAVSYGRIFSDGARKISSKKVPSHLKQWHDEIMELRNKRYAHNDVHSSVDISANFELEDNHVLMRPSMGMKFVLGAPKEWQPLFDWLGSYIYEQWERQLERLSELTGYVWSRPSGPPPSWL